MTTLALALLGKFWPFILLAGGFVFAFVKGDRRGYRRAEAKQAAKDKKAVEERLEMDREATDIERKVVALSDDDARAEADKWARR